MPKSIRGAGRATPDSFVALTAGEGGDLEAGTEREFFQDVVDVAFDRVGGDVEPGRDLLVAQAFGN